MYLIWFTRGLKSAQRNMCMCLSFSKASRRRKLLLHGFTYSTRKNFLFPKCVTASKKPSQTALSNVAWALFILPDPFSSCPGVSPIKEFALYKLPFLGLCHLVLMPSWRRMDTWAGAESTMTWRLCEHHKPARRLRPVQSALGLATCDLWPLEVTCVLFFSTVKWGWRWHLNKEAS